jgi:hypothetical protein
MRCNLLFVVYVCISNFYDLMELLLIIVILQALCNGLSALVIETPFDYAQGDKHHVQYEWKARAGGNAQSLVINILSRLT